MSIKSLMGNLLEAFKNKHGVLVASWKASDGSSWYRKYSDGWIEQGGSANGGTYGSPKSVTFPVSFSGTDYSFVISVLTSGGYNSCGAYGRARYTTYATASSYMNGNTTTMPIMWYACGY